MSSVIVREAKRDGQRVALLRCYDAANGGAVVEAQVVPSKGSGPVARGPYWFGTANEALRFLQEAMLALQYLGCTVASL